MSRPNRPPTSHNIRLPRAWVLVALALTHAAWLLVGAWGGRGTPWLGCTLGLAVSLTIFTAAMWGQRVRLDGTTLTGNVFVRREVDLAALTAVHVGGNPLPGGARSNDVVLLEDALGGRVTIPLRTFPTSRRQAIAAILRGPIEASGLELDDEARAFLAS